MLRIADDYDAMAVALEGIEEAIRTMDEFLEKHHIEP